MNVLNLSVPVLRPSGQRCPGAAGPAVHTQVLSAVSSRQELQLMDNGLQHHTGEQSPIHGRKGGAKGGLVIKSPRAGQSPAVISLTRRHCRDKYSIRKESELKCDRVK